MKKTIHFIIAILLLTAASFEVVRAEDNNLDLESKLSELKREKTQAEVMIIALENSGRLSEEQVIDAKREIDNSYEENIELLKTRALEKVQNKRSLSSF